MLTDSAAAASLTAVHLAIAILRRHRTARTGVFNPFVVASFAFVPTPWLWTSPVGMLLMLIGHVIWFGACEVLAPPPASPAVPGMSSAPASRVVPPAARQAAGPAPPRAGGFERVPVLAVLDEAADVKTFRLGRPAGFDFMPGQFVAVRIQIDGKPHVRCYSLSSAPETRGYLEISVRRQGLVSRTLHSTVRSGSQLAINRPAGQFVYPAQDDRPVALLAGGIGVTPLLSMLRHAVASDPTRPVTLLYSARREEDVAFLSELRVLSERHPQVRIGLTLTQPTRPTPWRQGRIDAAMIAQHISDPVNTVFCLCGPGPMLEDLKSALGTMGVPDNQVRFERFETAVAAVVLNAASAVGAVETGAAAAKSPAARAAHRVTFALTGRSATVDAARTLLDAADAEGVSIPSSCRAGVCQSCRTRVTGGEVDCQSDVLDPEDRAAGYVLPCVSWATTDCAIEA